MGSGSNPFKNVPVIGDFFGLFFGPDKPDIGKPPEVPDPEEVRRQSLAAAQADKIKKAGALNFSKLVKTGNQGLGVVPTANKGTSTKLSGS